MERVPRPFVVPSVGHYKHKIVVHKFGTRVPFVDALSVSVSRHSLIHQGDLSNHARAGRSLCPYIFHHGYVVAQQADAPGNPVQEWW